MLTRDSTVPTCPDDLHAWIIKRPFLNDATTAETSLQQQAAKRLLSKEALGLLWRTLIRSGVAGVESPESARNKFKTLYLCIDQAFGNAAGGVSEGLLREIAQDIETAERLCRKLLTLLLPSKFRRKQLSKFDICLLPTEELARVIAAQDFLGEPIEGSRFISFLRGVVESSRKRRGSDMRKRGKASQSTAERVRAGTLLPITLQSRKSRGTRAFQIEFIRQLSAKVRVSFGTPLHAVVAEAANVLNPNADPLTGADIRKLVAPLAPRKIREKK